MRRRHSAVWVDSRDAEKHLTIKDIAITHSNYSCCYNCFIVFSHCSNKRLYLKPLHRWPTGL